LLPNQLLPGDRTPLIPSRRFRHPVLPGSIFRSGESKRIAAPYSGNSMLEGNRESWIGV
jgi:hypothetical protein